MHEEKAGHPVVYKSLKPHCIEVSHIPEEKINSSEKQMQEAIFL